MTEQAPDPVDLGALSALAPQLAATFVSVASDVALVIDPGGVITNVALGAEPITSQPGDWVGRHWVDTVTGETRQKIEVIRNRLSSEFGYDEKSAEQVLQYVAALFARGEAKRSNPSEAA